MSFEPRSASRCSRRPRAALDNAPRSRSCSRARRARPRAAAGRAARPLPVADGRAVRRRGPRARRRPPAGPSALPAPRARRRSPSVPLPAQALAAAWCAAGPLAFVASRRGGRVADAGLVAYGAVEVLGAALVAANVDAAALPPGAIAALPNALAVQGVVAASWAYSATRPTEDSEQAPGDP